MGTTDCNYLAVRNIRRDGAGLPRDVGVNAASKTASDKLRMRGKPVTLAALKEASADGNSTVSARKTPIAKFFQYFVGAVVLFTTLAILFGLIVGGALGVSMVDMLGGLGMQIWAWGVWISLAIGGIATVIFGAIVTRSIFAWKVNRMSVITMIVAASVVFMSLASRRNI